MRRPDHNTTLLPRGLREELGLSETFGSNRQKQTIPGLRKERRKAARNEKKVKFSQRNLISPAESSRRTAVPTSNRKSSTKHNGKRDPTLRDQHKVQDSLSRLRSSSKEQKSESDPEDSDIHSSPPSLPKHVSRGVKDKLAAEDAEIATLEKALGVKNKKKLPKAFENDGLDLLLDGLEDDWDDESQRNKRKRDESDEWLEAKRKKARNAHHTVSKLEAESSDEIGEQDVSFDGLSAEQNELEDYDSSDEDIEVNGSDDSSSSASESPKRRIRENPYKAPGTTAVIAPRYVPPSLRNQASSETEDLSRLRRQIQGLINRLSEANMLSILGDVEGLYRNHARQHVSSTLLDLLLGLLSDPSPLQDTFVILHAGFLVALYKVIGSDFGAQTVQRIDEEFRVNHEMAPDDPRKGKKLANLTSLMSQLYTFQMISSNLIYDYIRLFATELSEEHAELLLKCIRSSGPQLRQDNPSALKEIILLVQGSVTSIGERNLSMRTKFMVETITNLKNNRIKTGVAASEVMAEHTVRMKKALGSLNTRNIKASEPLGIGLRDIRESDKRGKWWLIGANYKDTADDARQALPEDRLLHGVGDSIMAQDAGDNLLQMAREQRMNTDVRRSIFVGIMSATDYNDAFQRLMKLRLKKSQELEIPKVIVHCAAAETAYNPYYTLLARRVCSDRKLKKAFQFSLWDVFKRTGDGMDKGADEAEADDEKLGMKSIVNLARMFGALIAEGGMSLNVLKVLNFAYLQPKTSLFVELLNITIILHSQKGVRDSRDEKSVSAIFLQATDSTEMAKGLQYFLRKVVSKTDIAGTEADKETVKWGCKVARDALDVAISSQMVDQLQNHSLPAPYTLSNNRITVLQDGVTDHTQQKLGICTSSWEYQVACIEKRGALGGTCLNVGCIPSKSLLNNSHMYHQILHDTKKRGIDVGDVKLNLKQMMAAKDTSVQGLTKGVEFLFKKNNVEYVRGTGALAGEHEVRVNQIEGGEATFLAKNILIATGSEATPFPGLTIDEKKVITSTGAIALDQVPKKMVVIGGGIIGLEMGSVWSRLGSDVTVVEFLGQIGGPGMDAEISKTTQKILGKQGMKFKLNTKVLSGDDSGEGVKLEVESAKGGKKET
ncbi:MAG: hypothetical protein Q9177_005693, partial [Variospora cf. flavescens]